MGSKNHEVVPTPLIAQISGLRGGSGVHKNISALAKVGLIAKVKNASYDGYRLTYGGLDYLALNTHRKASTIFSLGNQIGVGKESDIYVVAAETGATLVLKIHRLGRISFRTVKANRDYLRNRSSGSWMYLSRLAAMKEYAFMKVLKREGFPVPEPIGQSRHTVIMEFINSFPLRQIESVPDPASLYSELMDLIVRLARVGLIHGDFNEFNILIREEAVPRDSQSDQQQPPPQSNDQSKESEPVSESQSVPDTSEDPQPSSTPPRQVKLTPIVIDFPQMLSTTHANAQFYFDRDVACIKRFFSRRFNFEADEDGPHFADAIKDSSKTTRLDIEVEATGFSRKMAKDLEKYIEAVGGDTEQESEEAAYEVVDGSVADGDDVEEETQDGDEDRGAEIPGESEFQNPKLAEALGGLSMHEQETSHAHGPGFTPLDLPDGPDAVAEKVQSKKKAAGWSI